MEHKNNRGFSGIVRTIVLAAAIAVFVFSAYRLYSIYRVYKMSGDEYRELSGSFTRPHTAGGSASSNDSGPSGTDGDVPEAGDAADASGRKSRLSIGGGRTDTSVPDHEEVTEDISISAEEDAGILQAEEQSASKAEEQSASKAEEQTASKAEEQPVPKAEDTGQESVPEESASSSAEEPASEKEKKKTSKTPESDKKYEDADPPLEVDWHELRSINPDIVGWICVDAVPGINYPICRGEDNDYYLHHTFRREYLFAGSIFEDYHNAADFSDANTIVYGHNMRDGSMFNKLKELQDQEKYAKNPYFWILTPKGNYRYHIFCATQAGARSDVYLLYEENGEEFLEWEKKIKDMSDVSNDVELSMDDKVVVLSTCTSDSSYRFIVAGKCVSSERPIKPTPIPTPPPPPPPRFRFLPRKEDVVQIFDEGDNYFEEEITHYDYDYGEDTDVYYGETYDDGTEIVGGGEADDEAIVLGTRRS